MSTVVPIFEAQNLVRHFPVRSGAFSKPRWLRAVQNVDLRIAAGESMALVGESGCGKSTMARLITQLDRPDSGTIRLEGKDVTGIKGQALQDYRRHVQLVFQDPLESLNPRQTIFQIVSRPLINFKLASKSELVGAVSTLLERVGLSPASRYLGRYPHQLSGGQRQRVGIAAALAVKPRLLVADEPVASLDISVRAQILNLLRQLQRDLNLALLFISHDLGVVRSLCDTTAVMYLGEIVEFGPTEQVFGDPRHPYTRALIAATPVARPRAGQDKERTVISGEIPSALSPPSGCAFHPRCPMAQAICTTQKPQRHELPGGHRVACHFNLDRA
jgi:oligopeptide/dipeptide ABC transporter ATP-binding protein